MLATHCSNVFGPSLWLGHQSKKGTEQQSRRNEKSVWRQKQPKWEAPRTDPSVQSSELLRYNTVAEEFSILRCSAPSLISGEAYWPCSCCGSLPLPGLDLGISWDFPASTKSKFDKGNPLQPGSPACSLEIRFFPIASAVLQHLHGAHNVPDTQIQVINSGNSRRHLGLSPNSISSVFSPCRKQDTGLAGFSHPQRLSFCFLIFYEPGAMPVV